MIQKQLWTLYNKLPTPTSSEVQRTRTLKLDVLRLKRDLAATSAQDDFAKWAKLRRQHDKAMAEHDEKGTIVQKLPLKSPITNAFNPFPPFSQNTSNLLA